MGFLDRFLGGGGSAKQSSPPPLPEFDYELMWVPGKEAVARALELGPANEAHRVMHQRLLRDLSETTNPPQSMLDSRTSEHNAATPWYKRLFGMG